MNRSGKFLSIYRSTALVLLNFIVLFVAVNVGLGLLFRLKDSHARRQAMKNVSRLHENASLRIVYPGMDAQSIDQLIRETWTRPYSYEAFTQFKERPYSGRFVNVSEAGYRVSAQQGRWPPDSQHFNIFVFGGSTTFGYGVPDDQTIASYLQGYLAAATSHDVCVYNFGRSSYVSRQERILFEELLIGGFVPDLALFIDGLNEFAFPEGPAETQRLQAVFETRQGTFTRWPAVEALPVTRLAHFARRWIDDRIQHRPQVLPENAEPTAAFDDGRYRDRNVIDGVIARYFQNKMLIESAAEAYGTRAVFVWQPIPLYKYDLKYHPFATGDFGSNFFARYGYAAMERRIQDDPPGEEFLWCADMQESMREPLYVDKVHYTARMSRLVAAAIGDRLIELGYGSIVSGRRP